MRFPFAGDNAPARETDEERFVWNGETIAFCIRRGSARRKRTAIRITGEGRVEVLLPPRAPRRLAFAAVRERGDWIVRHVRDMESRPRPEPLRYVDGEEHLFFGERYRLKLVPWDDETVFFPARKKMGGSLLLEHHNFFASGCVRPLPRRYTNVFSCGIRHKYKSV